MTFPSSRFIARLSRGRRRSNGFANDHSPCLTCANSHQRSPKYGPAAFGTLRPRVQIPPSRPSRSYQALALAYDELKALRWERGQADEAASASSWSAPYRRLSSLTRRSWL